MRRTKRCLIILLLSVLSASLLSTNVTAISKDNIPYDSYQFWNYQNGGYAVMPQPDCYVPQFSLGGKELIYEDFIEPTAIAGDKELYILDSGASKIVVLDREYKLSRVITEINYEGETLRFDGARGIYVDSNSNIYICDTQHERIIILNSAGELTRLIGRPVSDVIPETLKFNPISVTVDSRGNLLVLSEGCYYGAMVFDNEYNFTNFFGSNIVSATVFDFIKELITDVFTTDAKRQASLQALPFTFSDLCYDSGFLYTVSDITQNGKGQLRKLTFDGTNIYGGTGESDNIRFGVRGGGTRLANNSYIDSNLIAVALDSYGNVYALDSGYEKVYVYNQRCELITVFGGGMGSGNQIGTFSDSCDITFFGEDCIVLDKTQKTFTTFTVTDYGKNLFKANSAFLEGDYQDAKQYWEKVNLEDPYNQMAYTGIARALIETEDYNTAMEIARKGDDGYSYQLAFYQVRQRFINNHFLWIFIIAAAALIALIWLAFYTKRNSDKALIKNVKLRNFTHIIIHPVNAFGNIRNGAGSVSVASVMLLMLYVSQVLAITSCGFMHRTYDRSNYNSFLTFLGTTGVAILFITLNFLVSTLMQGRGRFKDVYIAVGYSITPLVLYNFLYLILSQVLVYDEASIFFVFETIAWVWTIFLIIIGLTIIHDYEFGSLVKSVAITLIGMVIAVFLGLLVLTLFQNLYNFFRDLIKEFLLHQSLK